MKKLRPIIVAVAAFFCVSCGNPSGPKSKSEPEPRTQDSRLFRVSATPGISYWRSDSCLLVIQDSLYTGDGNGTLISFETSIGRINPKDWRSADAYRSYDWYTSKSRIYINGATYHPDIRSFIGGVPREDVSFSYSFSEDSDTLTLSDCRPDTGRMVEFVGKYVRQQY